MTKKITLLIILTAGKLLSASDFPSNINFVIVDNNNCNKIAKNFLAKTNMKQEEAENLALGHAFFSKREKQKSSILSGPFITSFGVILQSKKSVLFAQYMPSILSKSFFSILQIMRDEKPKNLNITIFVHALDRQDPKLDSQLFIFAEKISNFFSKYNSQIEIIRYLVSKNQNPDSLRLGLAPDGSIFHIDKEKANLAEGYSWKPARKQEINSNCLVLSHQHKKWCSRPICAKFMHTNNMIQCQRCCKSWYCSNYCLAKNYLIHKKTCRLGQKLDGQIGLLCSHKKNNLRIY